MELDGYLDRLHRDLAAAVASGGQAAVEVAGRLASGLDAALRLVLLEALADAAAEITAGLDGATVEVRLHGRQPDLVVTATPSHADITTPLPPPPVPLAAAGDEAATAADAASAASAARITLRLPESVKQRAEDAAAAARQSVNTWLVDAIRTALRDPQPGRRRQVPGEHLSGWVR